jgi:hypothetical protein
MVLLVVTIDVTYLSGFSSSIFPHYSIPALHITPHSPRERSESGAMHGYIWHFFLLATALDE